MSCPVIHSKPTSTSPTHPRERVSQLSSALSAVGCESTIALYNYCQQKVATRGEGHCADQAELVLKCESKRRQVVTSLLEGQPSLLSAYDACTQTGSESDCLVEAEALVSRARRGMNPL